MPLKQCPQWAICMKPVSQCIACTSLEECAGCGCLVEMSDMAEVEFESDIGLRKGLLCSVCRGGK